MRKFIVAAVMAIGLVALWAAILPLLHLNHAIPQLLFTFML